MLTMLYESSSWSVDFPEEWEIDQDEYCTSFFSPAGAGALQISAAQNETGIVTEDDLLAQAAGRAAEGITISRAAGGEFVGLTASFDRENNAWREWWLGAADILLHATYLCAVEHRGKEDEAVDAILQSLRRITPAQFPLP